MKILGNIIFNKRNGVDYHKKQKKFNYKVLENKVIIFVK
jgi:hypothetical protein